MDGQRRIWVDSSVIESPLKLNVPVGKKIDLWAFVGNKKQLQILPPENELVKMRERYGAGKEEWQLAWDAGSDQEADIMRKLGGFLEIGCRHESAGKFRLTLPALAIDLKLAKVESPIVIFVSGSLFELWQPEAWTEKIVIPNVREFTNEVIDVTGAV